MVKESKKKVQEVEEPKQLDLDIKEPLSNKFYKAKRQFDFAVLKLEVIKFLKDPLVWALIVSGVILLFFQTNTIQQNFTEMPQYVPLFKFYLSSKDILASRKYIYAIPIISGCMVLITIFLVSRNYNREKNLTKILLVSTIMCILFLTIILLQIIRF